jgi:hypothetical protein
LVTPETWPGSREEEPGSPSVMYIGLGTVVVILLIVLIISFIRRA